MACKEGRSGAGLCDRRRIREDGDDGDDDDGRAPSNDPGTCHPAPVVEPTIPPPATTVVVVRGDNRGDRPDNWLAAPPRRNGLPLRLPLPTPPPPPAAPAAKAAARGELGGNLKRLGEGDRERSTPIPTVGLVPKEGRGIPTRGGVLAATENDGGRLAATGRGVLPARIGRRPRAEGGGRLKSGVDPPVVPRTRGLPDTEYDEAECTDSKLEVIVIGPAPPPTCAREEEEEKTSTCGFGWVGDGKEYRDEGG